MNATPPPGVIILAPPRELELGEEDDDRPGWRHHYDDDGDRDPPDLEKSCEFPERERAEGPPELLRSAKLFGCSGGTGSTRYREATAYRTMTDMTWPEARTA